MANKYMLPVNISNYKAGKIDDIGYEYDTGEIATPSNGDSIIIPDNIKTMSITLYISSGSGKMQATTSSLADVLAGSAIWKDWDLGVVTETTQDEVAPVTAIRMINVTGTTRLTVRAQ